MTNVLLSNIAKNKRSSIANTRIDTAYEKYRQYLRQYSISIANAIGSNTITAKLTNMMTLTSDLEKLQSSAHSDDEYLCQVLLKSLH